MSEEDLLKGAPVLEVIDTILVLVALAKVGWSPLPEVLAAARQSWLVAVRASGRTPGCRPRLHRRRVWDFLKQNGLQQPTIPLNGITILLVCVQPAIVELFFRVRPHQRTLPCYWVAHGRLGDGGDVRGGPHLTRSGCRTCSSWGRAGLRQGVGRAGPPDGHALLPQPRCTGDQGWLMTGMVVNSRPGGSVAAVIWLLLAVLAVVAAVLTSNVHWAARRATRACLHDRRPFHRPRR